MRASAYCHHRTIESKILLLHIIITDDDFFAVRTLYALLPFLQYE